MKDRIIKIKRILGKLLQLCLALVLLLYSIVFANLSAFDWAPESMKLGTARAANPNMMLFWDGNCASPPTGWTTVSDGAGEAFYDASDGGLFPRGNSSYGRYAGGAPTHTHTTTGASTAATSTDRKTGAGATHNATAHTHPVTVDSVSSISSLPGYENLCVIQYSGIPTGATAIPQGAIAIFDAAVPAGWTDVSSNFAANNEFIRGNSSAGGTGGGNTHQATGHSVSGTLTGVAGTIAKSGTTATRSSLANHTHTASGTSDTPDTQPQYQTIILGKADNNTTIPQKMIAMFDNSSFDSYGWEVLSNNGGPFYQRFLKVTGSYGSPSGANQHSHAVINATSSANTSDTGGSGSGTIPGHQHPVTFTPQDGTNTNNPPYTDVVIAKKSYIYTTLTATNAPDHGDTVTVDSTVTNDSNTALTGTHLKYVIFIDADASGHPDVGETYITTNCAGSGSWDDETEYTWETTGKDVAIGGNATDQRSCANTNFPSVTTYTVWAKWHNSADTFTYDTKSTTFASVPTLGGWLSIILAVIAVYLVYSQGYLRLKANPRDGPKIKSLALRLFKVRDFVFSKRKEKRDKRNLSPD